MDKNKEKKQYTRVDLYEQFADVRERVQAELQKKGALVPVNLAEFEKTIEEVSDLKKMKKAWKKQGGNTPWLNQLGDQKKAA